MKQRILKKMIPALLTTLLLVPIPSYAKKAELISMGECKITYYCACPICSGPWGDITATGTKCIEGRTVAVDPNTIAYGTKLLIAGHVYTAEDCGGKVKGDHIDIYINDHDLTEELGVKYMDVWIVKGGEWDE